jgi:hypothetical protein
LLRRRHDDPPAALRARQEEFESRTFGAGQVPLALDQLGLLGEQELLGL